MSESIFDRLDRKIKALERRKAEEILAKRAPHDAVMSAADFAAKNHAGPGGKVVSNAKPSKQEDPVLDDYDMFGISCC